jgi:hypothetical protein
MKNKIIITLAFVLSSIIKVQAQNAIYIVTEKFNGLSASQTYDSVFVTNPAGITTVQAIPFMTENLQNHNSSLNQIFNNITTLGYSMVGNGPMQLGFNLPSFYYTHTWYFQKP